MRLEIKYSNILKKYNYDSSCAKTSRRKCLKFAIFAFKFDPHNRCKENLKINLVYDLKNFTKQTKYPQLQLSFCNFSRNIYLVYVLQSNIFPISSRTPCILEISSRFLPMGSKKCMSLFSF